MKNKLIFIGFLFGIILGLLFIAADINKESLNEQCIELGYENGYKRIRTSEYTHDEYCINKQNEFIKVISVNNKLIKFKKTNE